MIPGTLLGLVALAAALGPGYLYVRQGERHHNRPVQSQLGELVEMVVIGGAASLLAAGLVLGASRWRGTIDATALHEDAAGYLLTHPWRCLAVASAFYALAYLIAFLAAWVVNRRNPATIVPGLTGWTQALHGRVPKGRVVVVRVELRDGRRLAGPLAAFTPALEADRELLLRRPIQVSAGAGQPDQLLEGDFLALREDQIAMLWGSYYDPRSE